MRTKSFRARHRARPGRRVARAGTRPAPTSRALPPGSTPRRHTATSSTSPPSACCRPSSPAVAQLATVKVGHAKATTDSAAAQRASAESANLDAALLGQGIPVDVMTATAPPSTGPTTRTLVPLPLAPLADIGLISGSVQATDAVPCVPAVNGVRTSLPRLHDAGRRHDRGERPHRLPRPGRRLPDHRDHPAGRQGRRRQRRRVHGHHEGRRHPAAGRPGPGARRRPGHAARHLGRHHGHRGVRRPADDHRERWAATTIPIPLNQQPVSIAVSHSGST